MINRSDPNKGPSPSFHYRGPPVPPDHIAVVRKAAIIAGAQLYEQPLSTTGFDDRLYDVHIQREDGRFVCSTLPVRALADLDLVVGWLRVWAHDPAEVEAVNKRKAEASNTNPAMVQASAPAGTLRLALSSDEREAKRLSRQRR